MFAGRKKGRMVSKIKANYDKVMNFESGQVQANVQFLIAEAVSNSFMWPDQDYALSIDPMPNIFRIRANMTVGKFNFSKKEFQQFTRNVYDHLDLYMCDVDWKVVMYIEMTNNRDQVMKLDNRSEDERQSAQLPHYKKIRDRYLF